MMNLLLSSSGSFDIEMTDLFLRECCPAINDSVLADFRMEIVLQGADRWILHYRAPLLGEGLFGVEIRPDRETNRVRMRYWVEGIEPSRTLDSFGVQFQAIENLRSFLRNGYTSWDGSAYADVDALADFGPQEARPETGYAMTQLLPRHGNQCLVIGFERHDRFQHTFGFDTRRCPPSLTITTLWDQKDRAGLPRCESEYVVILESDQAENGLRRWASVVAECSPIRPRIGGMQITGWSSWYNLYAYISEEIILNYLRRVREVSEREQLPMRVFQIDDGFTPEMGDWLEVKPQFPRGMKPVLDEIRRAGFIPGLWIGPFMVGNRSHIYLDHPDWVVKDRLTGGPLVQWRLVGEDRWHKRTEEYYILDATHPQAFEYLRGVFRIWRRDWGCEYFKTDFMYFGSDHGPGRAVWHTPGFTRIEVWRKVAEMIREEIGDALWLGCGCPLWASIGLVDGIRIGQDVGVDWRGRLSAQSLLNDLATRNFANQILWQADPDCILLRNNHHNLTDSEVRSLAVYAGMSGGVRLTSDDLQELSWDRLRLWKFILEMDANICNFPLLGSSPVIYDRVYPGYPSCAISHETRLMDPVVVQVRPKFNAQSDLSAIFVFNTGEHPVQRSIPLALLGFSGPRFIFDWTNGRRSTGTAECISATLNPHDGSVFLLSDHSFADETQGEIAPK
jgi:alpha-galactosidase